MSAVNAMGSAANPDVILSVNGLSVSFPGSAGRVVVLDDVSFQVQRGETLGLVGESGSGKSVTALAIMGLLGASGGRVDSGSIVLAGRELVGMSSKSLTTIRGSQLSMVFQEPLSSLNPVFTIGQQVVGVLRRHQSISRRAARQRAVELLDRVGIPNAAERLNQYPHNFSGGMRQRVLIAMAIACNPAMLIADEPTTALDVTIQARVLDLLQELQLESGMGMLFITHDLGVVAQLCQHVAVMYAGSIIEQSIAEELFDKPLHPYTEGMLQAQPVSVAEGDRLRSIPGTVPVPGSWASGCRFESRCSYGVPECGSPSAAREVTVSDRRMVRCSRSADLKLLGTGMYA